MEKIILDSKETKDFFIQAFQQRNIVPILGAGFSYGLPARRNNTVPNGLSLKKYMIDKIVNKKTDLTKEELTKEDFSFIAGLFERYYEDVSEVKDYFLDNYTGIKFPLNNKSRFLNEIEWDYIYTLNIDTAIENSSNDWEVFYPNRNFIDKNVYKNKKKLYKIHGDINMFCKTLSYEEMILSETQYIQSLETNIQFHNKLASDCGSKNLIYIGCSLDDEIDIKFSALSDKNKNSKDLDTYRIYVTSDKLTALKQEKLEAFNISHYIQLNDTREYELLYEFLVDCYIESRKDNEGNIYEFEYIQREKLNDNRENNLEYLSDTYSTTRNKPYYYIIRNEIEDLKVENKKINLIIGRRFSGKTLFAYNILDYYQNKKRYYVSSKESLDNKTFLEMVRQKNAVVVFDSDAITEEQFLVLIRLYEENDISLSDHIFMFINSYDDIVNLISYHKDKVHKPFESLLNEKFCESDLIKINKILNELGIAIFDKHLNILDNTLRISNTYEKKLSNYCLKDGVNELMMLIWLVVKNTMYYEEVVALGLTNKYREIVRAFGPFIQIENCKVNESSKHSTIKIVCNGKLGLLQILNNYAYPMEGEAGNAVLKTRLTNICEAIFNIMSRYDKIDSDRVKKFIMFDTLNDVFSRQFSKSNINYLVSKGKEGKRLYGASRIIQEIYENEKIKKLKAEDPNYWLQRAKSIYISNYRNKYSIQQLFSGIDCAKKAEKDSETKCNNGEKKYFRTLSNSVIQIALLYGRIASIKKYKDININTEAIKYYYAGISDSNNTEAAKSLIVNSRGTKDLNDIINNIKSNIKLIDIEFNKEFEYLCNIESKNGFVYRM